MVSTIPPRACAVPTRVTRADKVCREHICLELEVDSFPPSSPGQFLELHCNEAIDSPPTVHIWPEGGFPSLHGGEFTGRSPYLRRPFSVADRFSAGNRERLVVISRNIGPGTDFLDRLRSGDTLDVSGPLGTGFKLPDRERPVLLVGGGVGIPPLLYLARQLNERGVRNATVIFGAMSGELFPLRFIEVPPRDASPRPCVELPGDAPFPALITTDDGSAGIRGRVTDAIESLAPKISQSAAPLVYACGPDAMLRAIARQTRRLGWDCQLCIEKNMGCGLGTCLSCVTRVVDAARPAGWRWALTCTEGPVFERDLLVEYVT